MDDRYENFRGKKFSDGKIESFFDVLYLDRTIGDYRGDEYDFFKRAEREWNYDFESSYKSDMYAWENQPVVVVRDELPRNLYLPRLQDADEWEISEALRTLVEQLSAINHAILYVDHLSDRRLYQLLVKYVLPCEYKKPREGVPTYWNFCPFTETDDYDFLEDERTDDDLPFCAREQNWLTYYASDVERQRWAEEYNLDPPIKREAPYPRQYLHNLVDFH